MKRIAIIAAAVLVLGLATASVAMARSSQGVEKQNIVRIFEVDAPNIGEPIADPPAVGDAKLIRRDDGLKATAQVTGLKPGGVYTFWWLVGPPGFDFVGSAGADIPETFVALGGSRTIGKNGKATVRMNAKSGQAGIKDLLGDGTTAPFKATFDLDPMTAGVHIEVAYHGQSDSVEYSEQWHSDFWTGTACPANGANPNNPAGLPVDMVNPNQPHCPVSYVAIYPGTP